MGDASFGKYRLIAELGHGGMANVFLAVQDGPAGSGIRKLMVVKRLRQNLADEPEFVAMLVDEARIASRLNHPNVVQTNEVGQVGQDYFIAMEYLDGQPLHRIQHRSLQRAKNGSTPPVSQEQMYVVLMEALAGLHHAHELCDFDGTSLGIVHRDMSPHNIFVTYAGQVKVVDFGIAKAAGRSSETRAGVVKGKVRYMAPEQALGQKVDRRADVFSVGVILWEVAVGRRLWKDMDDLQVVQALVGSEVPSSPRAIDPSIPEGIDAICRKALAPNADERYATAEDFRADLEQFLSDERLLRGARRNLAPSIGELFKDKREEIKAVIESQLAAIETRISAEPVARRSSTAPQKSSAPIPVDEPEPRESQTGVTGVTDQVTALYDPSRRRRARGKILRGVGAVFAAFAIGATSVFAAWHAPTEGASQQPAADIALRVVVAPSSARITVDNAPPRSGPLDIRVAKDSQLHRVRVEAPGFAPHDQAVTFTDDVSLSVELRAMPEALGPAPDRKDARDRHKRPTPSIASVSGTKTGARPAPDSGETKHVTKTTDNHDNPRTIK